MIAIYNIVLNGYYVTSYGKYNVYTLQHAYIFIMYGVCLQKKKHKLLIRL